MENIILISKCWEKVEVGYASTHIKMNRATNAIISVSYRWYPTLSLDNAKSFDSFESLNAFINELIDARNEAELNSLESQTYKG